MPYQTTELLPREVALRLRVSINKVLSWIKRGDLRAINVATPGSHRPRYRIDVKDLAAFRESRLVQPPAPRRPRKKPTPGVTEYV